MDSILAPDLDYIHSMASPKIPEGSGLYGIWAEGNIDGWVGREGEMVREVMGGEDSGRVVVVPRVPHAFCLCKFRLEI